MKLRKIFSFIYLSFWLLTAGSIALAAPTSPSTTAPRATTSVPGGGADEVTHLTLPAAIEEAKLKDIKLIFSSVVDYLLLVAAALAIIAIIYSGLMYITSAGDTARAEAARKNLIWAITGLVIIMTSYVIIEVVKSVF